MSFTTPAFIRKNTPELLNELADLGYNVDRIFSGANLLYCIYAEVLFYYDDKHPEKHAYGSGIDCGTNEQLFLALAALRDDSDYMQWFTDGKEWIFCDREDWVDMYSVLCCGKGHDYQYVLDKYHKATVEELIEHFKTKEQ